MSVVELSASEKLFMLQLYSIYLASPFSLFIFQGLMKGTPVLPPSTNYLLLPT